MQEQLEIFDAPRQVSLTLPPNSKEPRLWVRRLAIWEEPAGRVIQDIPLRPGLNIVWSPDGKDEAESDTTQEIGHGSGKTLFCRLLRYCLGESRFADEQQRDRIATAFPEGLVGAEVMLDGVCWAVLRSLGARRRHVALENGNLDAIASGEGSSTTIEPLMNAIEHAILTPEVAPLARLALGQKAWPIALAWLTRDQECRFNDVLDWRSPVSGSEAPIPASGREIGPRRDALRAFLGAITAEEQSCRQKEEALRAEIERIERKLSNMNWENKQRFNRLTTALHLPNETAPDTPLLLEMFRNAAEARIAEASGLPAGNPLAISTARMALKRAQEEFRLRDEERVRIESQAPAENRVLTFLRGEIPTLSYAAENAASQICPICEVPIDIALATQCKLSHKLHNENECRARLESKRQEIGSQEKKIAALRERTDALMLELPGFRQKVIEAEAALLAVESIQERRDSAWQAAIQTKGEVDRFFEQSEKRSKIQETLRETVQKLAAERERLSAFRDGQERTFGMISQKFSSIIQRLIGGKASGKVALTGHGLEIVVNVDGDRRTAAIESLKVIAFDLACLCLSVEQRTRIPAFFVHDSPREADLGLSIYDEIFHLVRELEASSETPLFQYIVTTTTRPPESVRIKPWIVLKLHGAPGTKRLMGADL